MGKEKQTNTRIIWIDVIRAGCILWIVGYWHLEQYIDFTIQKGCYISHVTYGVLACFSLLSGFFAVSPMKSTRDILLFYKKKLLRIAPLFLLASLLFVLCDYVSVDKLIRCITCIGIIQGNPPTTLWYVCMLFIFFIITPLFLMMKNKDVKYFLFAVVFLGFYLLNRYIGTDLRIFYLSPFYFAGIIIRENEYHLSIGNINKWIRTLSIIIAGIIFIISSKYAGRDFAPPTFISSIAFIWGYVSVVESFFGKLEKNTIIEKLSYASFCMYLFHRTIYYALKQVIGPFNVITTYIICLPIVILFSYAIQFCYDSILKLLFVHKS